MRGIERRRRVPLEKVCPVCGSVFYSYYGNQKYCGTECAGGLVRVERELPRNCARCGGVYHPTRSWQKYCSQRCQLMDYNATHDIAGMLRERRVQDEKRLKELVKEKKGG